MKHAKAFSQHKELSDHEHKQIAELRQWIVHAEPASERVYYTGGLSADALSNQFVDEIRSIAWNAMQNGFLRLIQRRTNHLGIFDYVAIKRVPQPPKDR
jgi:hypothetical protein